MERTTILVRADCDLKRLPLDALEAFVLSQVDGLLTLEEIAEIAGLDFVKTSRLAQHLLDLGAVTASALPRPDARPSRSPYSERRPVRPSSGETDPVRVDPRAEKASVHPEAPRVDPRAEQDSGRREAPKERERPRSDPREVRKERRRSTKGFRAVRSSSGANVPPANAGNAANAGPAKAGNAANAGSANAGNDLCDLDEATATRIATLDAKLVTLDHYAILEIERGAEKRDVKRAYFAMAAKFHPDRFFGKKLGPARAALDRIFMRLTDAHDILSNAARREAYDATLPGGAAKRRPTSRVSKSGLSKAQGLTPRKSSKALKAAGARSHDPTKKTSSPAEKAVTRPPQPPVAVSVRVGPLPTTPPAGKAMTGPPPAASVSTRASPLPTSPPARAAMTGPPPAASVSVRVPPRLTNPPVEKAMTGPPPPGALVSMRVGPLTRGAGETVPPAAEGKFRQIYAAARQIEGQRHADLFLQAAEDALRVDDVVGAANNYRLALQVAEDPVIRQKFEAVEELAKSSRSEKNLVLARAAERDKRWSDAALYFGKANTARPVAAVAERAAYSLRVSGGDLRAAVSLAEQAASLDPKNVECRITLGEVYLAADLVLRAAAEVAKALELAPQNVRAKELAAALAKKKK